MLADLAGVFTFREEGSLQLRALATAFAIAVSVGSAAVNLDAQLVVNSLRGGWSDSELGWSGNLNADFTLSRGNADYTFLSAGAALQVLGLRHRMRGLASERLVRASGEKVTEDFVLHLRHNYRLGVTSALSSVAFIQTQHAPFWRLERRTLLGAGGRWDVVRGQVVDFSIGATYMLERERLTADVGGASKTDHRGSYFVSLLARPNEMARLDLSGFYQPRFSDFSDARLFATAATSFTLVGGLKLTTSLEYQHDSEPAPGVERTEILFRSGIEFVF